MHWLVYPSSVNRVMCVLISIFLDSKREHKWFWAEFLQTVPQFNQLSNVSVGCIFWFVSVVPKYFHFATFSKYFMAILMLWLFLHSVDEIHTVLSGSVEVGKNCQFGTRSRMRCYTYPLFHSPSNSRPTLRYTTPRYFTPICWIPWTNIFIASEKKNWVLEAEAFVFWLRLLISSRFCTHEWEILQPQQNPVPMGSLM